MTKPKDFPGAIRGDTRQLQIGETYLKVYKRFPHVMAGRLLFGPYYVPFKSFSGGAWWIDVRLADGMIDQWALEDVGVVPYDGGHWNESNYLIHDRRMKKRRGA